MSAIVQKQDDNRADLIFEAAMRLHETLDAGRVIRACMEMLPRMVDAELWAIYLRSGQAEGRLELVQAINPSLIPLDPLLDLSDRSAALARAAADLRPVVVTLPESHASERPQDERQVALLCLPLHVNDRLIGAAQAARTLGRDGEGRVGFADGEARLAEQACGLIARAIANAIDYADATRQCLIDDLTRLYNVRYLYQTLDNEIRRARRYGSHVSIVFMDLDGFKLVNDAYGHRAGSVTLTEVAKVIMDSVREADFVARYGGDEFVMMLPETSAPSALQVAERVRAEIESHAFSGGVGAEIRLTASFGVASFPEHATQAEKLIELADAAMYEAKQQDKNNVCLAAQ